ncbi:diguanylate cyclase [Uliginosibacterium paludis]|uniref:diguanylate cyclase n=1 Tax=Uliginosibacterium paludis TaxID=1615952 RepID=A0ABV2CP89_9RHOO
MAAAEARGTSVFEWSDRFETGLAAIDHEHAQLAGLLGRLDQLAGQAGDAAMAEALFDTLLKNLDDHFAHEEALMSRYGLAPASTERHVTLHRQLRARMGQLRHESPEASHADVLRQRGAVLSREIMRHLLCADLPLATEIAALEQGASPEAARLAGLERRDASIAALLDDVGELRQTLAQRDAALQAIRAEQLRSEECHARAQRAARTGSWELDLDSFRLESSAECQRLFGQHPDAPIRHFDDVIHCIPESDRQAVFDAISATLHSSRPFMVEHRINLSDGSQRWLQPLGERISGSHGKGDRLVGMVRDVTEERAARIHLEETNRQLSLSLSSLARHAADLTRLNELNEGLQSCLNAGEAFEVVENAMSRLEIGTGGALSVPDAAPGTMRTVARWGDGGRVSAQFANSACWALRRGLRHTVCTANDGPGCKHFEPDAGHGYICLPLQVLGEPLGLLTLRAGQDVDEVDWARFTHLAGMVAESLKLALSNVRLREALHDQATRDPLTGLLNRRYLDEALPREIARSLREQRTLSLVMLDLDHFKRVNDNFGHEAGDAVLSKSAAILRSNLRSSDLACRFGGEEFVVLMPGATLAEAHERMERILHEVCATVFHLDSVHLPGISFSAGVAEAPRHGNNAESLLRAADRALYAAKEAGRQRVLDAG